MKRKQVLFALKWVLLVVGFNGSQSVLAATEKPPVPVIAYEVVTTQLPVELKLLGSLQAKASVDIVAKATDVISAMHFEDGEKVSKRALLVEQNAQEELALLEEAKALEAEAKRQYDRVKVIEGKGSVTESLVDERFRLWKTAEAKSKVIQAQVSDRRIYAPFAGRLGFKKLNEGAFATAGTYIVSLDDTSSMYLDLFVPGRYLSGLSVGQAIDVRSEAFQNQVFVGRITAISPRVDAVLRMVQVRALIQNPKAQLKTNMMVQANLQLNAQPALHVPNTAIEMLGDRQFVYRLMPSNVQQQFRLEKVEITVGQKGSQLTEVLTGLAAGDQVVSQGLMGISLKRPVVIKVMQTDQSQAELLTVKPVSIQRTH